MSLGEASPLKALDWTENGPIITQAVDLNRQAAQLRKDAEKATEARDNLVDPLNEFVRQCRDVLLGINRSNPRVLGDYGFTVNDSPPKKNGTGDSQPK